MVRSALRPGPPRFAAPGGRLNGMTPMLGLWFAVHVFWREFFNLAATVLFTSISQFSVSSVEPSVFLPGRVRALHPLHRPVGGPGCAPAPASHAHGLPTPAPHPPSGPDLGLARCRRRSWLPSLPSGMSALPGNTPWGLPRSGVPPVHPPNGPHRAGPGQHPLCPPSQAWQRRPHPRTQHTYERRFPTSEGLLSSGATENSCHSVISESVL